MPALETLTRPRLQDGAGNRNRTYDLIITNDALYQLSYSGAEGLRIIDGDPGGDKIERIVGLACP